MEENENIPVLISSKPLKSEFANVQKIAITCGNVSSTSNFRYSFVYFEQYKLIKYKVINQQFVLLT